MTINNWAVFEKAEPEFAAAVRARFARFPHHVLGTLRKDGSPASPASTSTSGAGSCGSA